MTKIFEPILNSVIIYIDDILLFSKDKESHKVLLEQFISLADQHGIMLSEKKIHLAQLEIDFLGMHFSQGTYQPQPHIAQELLKFPDCSLTIKEIQQFLGILNYIRDFIPKVARYTSPLSRLLKKDPPPWGIEQTRVVSEIKKIAQHPPALKIPRNWKRIQQTDASNHYWGAVLMEENGNHLDYCGHASGEFKEAEKHYHTTFKEAFAVKNGIKKFDFHLRGFQFEVQMDNSSFPRILEFKNKMPPDPQILRLKDWFSRYDFSVKYLKGKNNLIPDFLSRPRKAIQMITAINTFPLIFMVKTLPNMAKIQKEYPPGLYPTSPTDILQFAHSRYFYYLHETLKYKYSLPCMLDPNNELGGIYELFLGVGCDICEPTLWVIWCKIVQRSIPLALKVQETYNILNDPFKHDYLFWTLLEWFSPIPWWRHELEKILHYQRQRNVDLSKSTSIVIIHRPYYQNHSRAIWSKNKAYFWGTFDDYPISESYRLQLVRHLREIRQGENHTAGFYYHRNSISLKNNFRYQET